MSKEIRNQDTDNTEDKNTGNSVDADPNVSRRVVLTRLAKLTGYAAPVTLALLSMNAKAACSLTC